MILNENDLKALATIVGRRAAEEILSRYTLSDLACLTRNTLLKMPYIGLKKADSIIALPTLFQRFSFFPVEGITVSTSRDVYELFRPRIGRHLRERFLSLALNSRNIILAEDVCAVGTVNTVHINPSEILREAILRSAASLICLHNHPSGDPSPSPEDHSLTQRVSRAATLMGIRFLDHIIIAPDSYYSFSDAGEL